jgi:hypothetical protein
MGKLVNPKYYKRDVQKKTTTKEKKKVQYMSVHWLLHDSCGKYSIYSN